MKKMYLVIAMLTGLALGMFTCSSTPVVEAQFAGQPAFQVPITVPPGVGTLVIPACTTNAPTATNPCIPNRNQIGHSVGWQFSADGGTVNSFTLEGSNDNSNWSAVLCAGNSGGNNGLATGTSYANGYYTYLRFEIVHPTSTVSIIYTGLSQPTPINPITTTARSTAIGTRPLGVLTTLISNPTTPFLVNGLQCSNPNNAVSSGTIVFTGAGLNDMTKSGTYSCPGGRRFLVQVDSVGATDTFQWSDDGGVSFRATGIAMTGAAQLLECGISVTFGAVTGHTLNESWTFNATDGTAYLKLYWALSANPFYEIGIPPGQNFNYSGPAMMSPRLLGSLRATAVTMPGNTYEDQIPTAIGCSFQLNPYGPFYPFTSRGFQP